MGYTHYLDRPPELDLPTWRRWVDDVRLILRSLPERTSITLYPLDGPSYTLTVPLQVAGPLGTGRPQLTDELVSFNGGEHVDVDGRQVRLGCETFHVERVTQPEEWQEPDVRGWIFECCKTRRMPYDLAVTACLVRLAYHFPEGVEVSSDGGPQEWEAGMELCRRLFGFAVLPFAIPGGAPSGDQAAGGAS
jgi:hypothetical protein